MSKKDLVQALVDYFGLNLEEELTDENLESVLSSYDFTAGCYMGYGGNRFSLGEVVRALEGLCEDGW